MTKFITNFIDRTTMYRLVLYYLAGLLAAAFVLGFFKIMPQDPTKIAFSTVLILISCAASNWVFAKIFRTPPNYESPYITALIIALIMSPVAASDLAGVGALISASVWAIASKFIFAIGRKHVFNPAALGVALTAVLLNQPATWWVAGNVAMLPFVVLGGLLIGRKLQRFDLIGAFLLVNLATVLATATPDSYLNTISETLINSPALFFAFVMLTEPLTAPQARWPRLAYAALVGILAAPNVHFGDFYLTPELALLAGNLFNFLISPKGKFALTLVRIEQAGAGAYDFIFKSDRKLSFQPGQYLEWTLGVKHPDNRGNRRHFTIASAPTEPLVRLGVKFYEESSSFKRALAAMKPGDQIQASQLGGSFVLPKDPEMKLAFIAGGIGITPFRSMVGSFLDSKDRRDAVLLYSNRIIEDIAYYDFFERARTQFGMKTVYALTDDTFTFPGAHTGAIDAKLIIREIPDYQERT
ncbi:MAG: hypothetical protein JWN11_2755, partial [Hyphomicrobiales bacterium]|nr:hypothetical protein [Hyphomicrobiales bacterium]